VPLATAGRNGLQPVEVIAKLGVVSEPGGSRVPLVVHGRSDETNARRRGGGARGSAATAAVAGVDEIVRETCGR